MTHKGLPCQNIIGLDNILQNLRIVRKVLKKKTLLQDLRIVRINLKDNGGIAGKAKQCECSIMQMVEKE